MISVSRLLRGALAALALTVAAPRAAAAQDPLTVALARLEPGDQVRVVTRAGRAVQGTLVAWDGDSVKVRTDTRLAALPRGEVSGVWVRGRSVKRGAIIGGTLGFVAGALFGALLSTLDDAEADADAVVLVGGAGAAVGGAGGGIIGAAVPRWRQVYAAGARTSAPGDEAYEAPEVRPAGGPDAEPEEVPEPERRRLGSTTVAGGFARLVGDGGSSGGPEARVSFLGEWYLGGEPGTRRPFFSIGPELGYASLGTTPPRPHCEPGCGDFVTYAREYDAVVARGLARLGVEDGALRGYAVAGLGLQGLSVKGERPAGQAAASTERIDHKAVGWTYGAGAQLRTGLRDAWGIELRRNEMDVVIGDMAHGYWALSATYTRTW